MTRPLAAALAALATLVVAAAPAAAQRAPWMPFRATATLEPVRVDGQGRYLVRGPIVSARLGEGTGSYLATIDGTTVTAPVRGRFPGGTLRGTTRGTLTPSQRPGIVNEIAGRGRITGGTGRFEQARGRFTFTGQSHDDGTVELTLAGRVRNPEMAR